MLSHIISLLLFGVATSFSPGPNNIMTAYTMFNFGFKKTIPTILGVITGWTVLIIVLQLGSSAVFQKIDSLQNIIKIFYKIGPRRAGDVEEIYSDNSKINEELSWFPVMSFESALKTALKWEKNK